MIIENLNHHITAIVNMMADCNIFLLGKAITVFIGFVEVRRRHLNKTGWTSLRESCDILHPWKSERESCLLKQSIQFPYSHSVLLFEIEYTHQMIINTSTLGPWEEHYLWETVHMGFSHLRKHIGLIYTGHSQIDAYFSLQVLTDRTITANIALHHRQ